MSKLKGIYLASFTANHPNHYIIYQDINGLISMGKFINNEIENILNQTINDMLDFGHRQTKKGD